MMLLDGFAYSVEGIFYYLSVFGELLLITSCLATIVYIATKNQYISYLAAGPIYFALSHIFYHSSQLFLVIIAMSVQALVILFIQKKGLLGKLATKTQAPRAE